ncbi:MAG TPA: UDP-2,4-diacetamido-2,4,6-trideoxy-beta-L-altropyranose hydrolase [Steroidobacter sp.]|uniref:UDP-2,4-diacetamido-2,4, 6-trideoxy-beta-L-altropyranose hydrolase n=1 Tax=Steroidobacter sp. TaxID=1978227 RepID=UPI002ED7A3A1
MHVAIRADASRLIGIGHVMRCLTLADALAARGARVRFVCRQIPRSLQDLIGARGHEIVVLRPPESPEMPDQLRHSSFLDVSLDLDAADTRTALRGYRWDWLIVDHYGIDARWETSMRDEVRRILIVDDLADRVHECDVLLDQNIFPDMHTRYATLMPHRCRALLGPRYALLREEFQKVRAQVLPRRRGLKRVLVLFGGVDPHNLTGRALAALDSLSGMSLAADVVIGEEHPCRAEIQSHCARAGYVCYVQTDRLAPLMASADLALGAGGSTSWERCCLGLATLCASFAENQYGIARALEAEGACIFLGDEPAITPESIAAAIEALQADPQRLFEMSSRAFSLVDGGGASRVCDVLAEAS